MQLALPRSVDGITPLFTDRGSAEKETDPMRRCDWCHGNLFRAQEDDAPGAPAWRCLQCGRRFQPGFEPFAMPLDRRGIPNDRMASTHGLRM